MFSHGYLGLKNTALLSPPSSQATYIAPYYYSSYTGAHTIYYRETNNQTFLKQVSKDIAAVYPSMGFTPKHVLVATYIYSDTKFQVALVTNGTDTFSVFNYELLSTDPTNIGMNEYGCGNVRSLIASTNGMDLAIKGNKTGVRGRHVFYLTNKSCFKRALGVRAVRSTITGIYRLFTSRKESVHKVLKINEYGNTSMYFKEIVTGGEIPTAVVLFKPSTIDPFKIFYGFFHAAPKTVFKDTYSSNLFVFEGTPNTNTFQYGNVNFPPVHSSSVCKTVFFEQKMKSKPAVKISPVISDDNNEDYVNVWLKSVTNSSFTVCAREMIAFSGQRNITINYIATSAGDANFQEINEIIFPTSSQSKRCLIKKFDNEYINNPDIFVSVEVDHDEPSMVWLKSVTTKQAEICLKTITHNKAHKVHIILTGDVSPCTHHKCPNHLECRLTSSKQTYCGCITNCVGKEGRGRRTWGDLRI